MFTSLKKEFKIPFNWLYRGEGNCNVVISLPSERKILRIRKTKKATSLLIWLLNWITDIIYWYCGSGSDEELRDLRFYQTVIRPLIGTKFVCNAQQVFLSKKQVKILEERLADQRPEYRKCKGLQYGRAALFDDYAFLPHDYYPFLSSSDTFAVEIKPKQGWIPFSEKHYPKCIFCMNQYLKRQRGRIKSLTSYCPQNLFSGDAVKMKNAIRALLDSPQNNFKIFKNGSLCYGENSDPQTVENIVRDFFENKSECTESLLLEFCLLLQKCLLTSFDPTDEGNECNVRLFCRWNKVIQENTTQNLPKGSVLERILSVQMLDVEGHQYYCKLLRNSNLGDFDYVKPLLKEVSRRHGACLKCTVMMLGNGGTGSVRNHDLLIVPYLMSAIAKDCSLIVTFKKLAEAASDDFDMRNVVSTKFGSFIVNIGVFDLYPKPISTVFKRRRNVRKMLELLNKRDTVT